MIEFHLFYFIFYGFSPMNQRNDFEEIKLAGVTVTLSISKCSKSEK